MAARPWLKFYPADWRADPRLRMCSLAARGLWIDLISYMHEGEPYGHFTIDGVMPEVADIASLIGRPVAEVRRALDELEARQVFSRTEDGVIYSRRMVRDNARDERDRKNGKGGGNPNLKREDKRGVNPQDKAQKLEARIQKALPDGTGSEEVPADGFVIRFDTPQARAWEKHNGKPFAWGMRGTRIVASEWPPGHGPPSSEDQVASPLVQSVRATQ